MTPLTVLDLFSGIGGFSLGLERTGGFKTIAFCEIEPYPRAVLAKHWPEVPCYDDVRTLTAERMAADGLVRPDAICGGFPCQDISNAGERAGLAGARSGLWSEFARLIGELRPCYVIVENVAALLGRGIGCVLGDLAALGYDAEWHCIPAGAVGAPHRRDRVWIVAYANGFDGRARWKGRPDPGCSRQQIAERTLPVDMAYSNIPGSPLGQGVRSDARAQRPPVVRSGWPRHQWWAIEPTVGRVADGVPSRVDRIAGLGNAVVPQVVEIIGRAILQAQSEERALTFV